MAVSRFWPSLEGCLRFRSGCEFLIDENDRELSGGENKTELGNGFSGRARPFPFPLDDCTDSDRLRDETMSFLERTWKDWVLARPIGCLARREEDAGMLGNYTFYQ